MPKIIFLLLVTMLAGCATTSDVKNIQTQIADINAQVKQISVQSAGSVQSSIEAMELANVVLVNTFVTNRKINTIIDSMYQK